MIAELVLQITGALVLLGLGLTIACAGLHWFGQAIAHLQGRMIHRRLLTILSVHGEKVSGVDAELDLRISLVITPDELQKRYFTSGDEANALILTKRVLIAIAKDVRGRRPERAVDVYPRWINKDGLGVD